jgi:hypothetical protein
MSDGTSGNLTGGDILKLKALRVSYWVLAGGVSAVACMPLLLMAQAGWALGDARGVVANVVMVAWMVGGAGLAACLIAVSRNIRARRGRTFNLVVTGVAAAVCVPLGTVIGAFAFVVLLQPQIDALFRSGRR